MLKADPPEKRRSGGNDRLHSVDTLVLSTKAAKRVAMHDLCAACMALRKAPCQVHSHYTTACEVLIDEVIFHLGISNCTVNSSSFIDLIVSMKIRSDVNKDVSRL